jgi:hypothetical protein
MSGTLVNENELIPSCTLDELIAEVRRYRPSDVLSFVRDWSDRFEDHLTAQGNLPMFVRIPRHISYLGLDQQIAVTHHFLAMIARLSLLNGYSLSPGILNGDRFLRVLRLATELYDPADKGHAERMFFREIAKQAPYQDDKWPPIPRALLLYCDAAQRVKDRPFDIDAEFKAHFGLDVKTFLTIGFLLFAQFTSERAFYPRVGWHTTHGAVSELGILTRENIEALLGLVSADQARFKQECIDRSTSGTGNDQYDWNALFKYPAIDVGAGNLVLPIGRLLLYRLEDAPFYELADLHRGEGGKNRFRAFFGSVFQEYVGLLLDEAFPSQARREAGSPPVDWLLRVRDHAVLIECRMSEFTMPTKSTGASSLVERDLERIARETIDRLPAKKDFLEAHASDFDLDGVKTWHYLVVVRKPLLPVPLIRGWLDRLLTNPVPYHLLSIADFEQLMALNEDGIEEILADKASPSEITKDFRSFFNDRRGKYRFRRNPLLQRTFNDYFSLLGVPGD